METKSKNEKENKKKKYKNKVRNTKLENEKKKNLTILLKNLIFQLTSHDGIGNKNKHVVE